MSLSKTRVLFLNTRSALGADVAVHLTLIQNLDPSQVEVHVATNRNSTDLDQTLAILNTVPDLKPLVLNLGTEMSVPGGGKQARLRGLLRNIAVLPSLARLAWYIRSKHIDIIHSTDRPRDALFSSLLARMTGCRYVMHVHIKWDSGIGRAAQWAVKQCAGVIAISEYCRRSLLAGGVEDAKIYTCMNATDTVRYDPKLARRGQFRLPIGISKDTPVIGIVARIMIWKGHLELVEALARVKESIPNVCLVIVGVADLYAAQSGDSFEAKVRARINELGLNDNVVWAGWRENMPEVMADFDVLCVPSWEEPFGLVITEGMAMQRPVVGFESGALPEILTDGVEGRLVPARDTKLLADALLALLRDPALCAEMGQRGRTRVCSHFTPRRQADEMAVIYSQIVTGMRANSQNQQNLIDNP